MTSPIKPKKLDSWVYYWHAISTNRNAISRSFDAHVRRDDDASRGDMMYQHRGEAAVYEKAGAFRPAYAGIIITKHR